MKLYGAERPLELPSYIMHRCKSHQNTSGEFWEEEEHDEPRTPRLDRNDLFISCHHRWAFYQCTVTDNRLSGSCDGAKTVLYSLLCLIL